MLIVYRDVELQFTEIKLADLKNLSHFLLKTNIFKIHSQQKFSTKREDSLSCIYEEQIVFQKMNVVNCI